MRAVSNPRCAQQDCSAETNSHHRQIQSLLDALVSEGLDAEKMSEIRDVLENHMRENKLLMDLVNKLEAELGNVQQQVVMLEERLDLAEQLTKCRSEVRLLENRAKGTERRLRQSERSSVP
ncbi:hypothetical protein FOZ63_021424, partial [Perkinsus olseni]